MATVTSVVLPREAAASSTATVQATGGQYVALTPAILLDTRQKNTLLPNGGEMLVPAADFAGVPATGALAVAVSITALTPTGAGRLFVYPSGEPRPARAQVDYAHASKAGFDIVRLGQDGRLRVYNAASGSTHVVIRVRGYYTNGIGTAPGWRYVPASPTTALDTRLTSKLVGGTAVQVNAGVPSTARAVAINVVALGPANWGHLRVYRADRAVPSDWTVNYDPTANVSNAEVVELDTNGRFAVYNSASATTSIDVVVRVRGYYIAAEDTSGGGVFVPVNQSTFLDTQRDGGSPIAGGTTRSIAIAGIADVPRQGVSAVALSVTAADAPGVGRVIIYPDNEKTQPSDSTLNYEAGTTTNHDIVRFTGARGVKVWVSMTTHLVVRVDGYFLAPTTPGAPTDIHATNVDSSGRSTVTWTPPWDGGAHITSYRVTASPGGVPMTTTGPSAVLTGLDPSTVSAFTVVAKNSLGEGEASELGGFTRANITAPDTPTDLTAEPIVAQDGSIDFRFTGVGTDSDGGETSLEFSLFADPTRLVDVAVNLPTVLGPAGRTASVIVDGQKLTDGTTYWLTARAYDDRSHSEWSTNLQWVANKRPPDDALDPVVPQLRNRILLIHGVNRGGGEGGRGRSNCQTDFKSFVDYLRDKGYTRITTVQYYHQDVNCDRHMYNHHADGYFDGVWNHSPWRAVGAPWSHESVAGGTDDVNWTAAHTNDADIKHLGKHLAHFISERQWAYGPDGEPYFNVGDLDLEPGDPVDVAAHSMGGLLLRWALYGSNEATERTSWAVETGWPSSLSFSVEDAVTVGTPHNGSKFRDEVMSHGCQKWQCTQMSVNSPFVKELRAMNVVGGPQTRHGTNWTTIGSDADEAVSATSAVHMKSTHRITYERSWGCTSCKHAPQHSDYFHRTELDQGYWAYHGFDDPGHDDASTSSRNFESPVVAIENALTRDDW